MTPSRRSATVTHAEKVTRNLKSTRFGAHTTTSQSISLSSGMTTIGVFLTIEDAERVTPEEDTGECNSMDICDAWNQYAAAVPLLIEEAEEHEATAEELSAPYYWYAPSLTSYDEPESASIWYKAHSDHADRCRAKAEELAEKANDALEHEVKALIEGAEEYYQSPEFWREWYSEGDERFTRDGERI